MQQMNIDSFVKLWQPCHKYDLQKRDEIIIFFIIMPLCGTTGRNFVSAFEFTCDTNLRAFPVKLELPEVDLIVLND